ncbi:MAG: phosphotransferase [Tabrizicola sp.]|nr:phosphotransferase [Tabrizicola sp.]
MQPPHELLADWKLTDPVPLADTPRALLWRVRYRGTSAVLKLARPDAAEEVRGGMVLRWYDGIGAARVLQMSGRAILMEALSGPRLGDIVRGGEDARATAILAGVIAGLHHDRPPPPAGLEPLALRMQPLLERASSGPLAEAATIARQLLRDPAPVVVLHGDLHHDNILGSDRGWLAIDPKGVLGDLAYEPANAFRNPEGMGDLARHPDRIAALAATLSVGPGLDRRRLLGWAAAHCGLSCCWHDKDHRAVRAELAQLSPLLAAYRSG